MDRDAFYHAVFLSWAERYNCTVDDLHRPGTVILPDEQFAGSGAVHVWTIGERAFARPDPDVADTVRRAMGDLLNTRPLTGARLEAALGPDAVARVEDSRLRYLYPPDFRPVDPPVPYTIRKLTTDDAGALAAMKESCTADEIEMGEVSVDDEIGFGCSDGSRLAAVATGFRLTGFMDIGVLTNPAYRRQGLGKAVVSALCRWCIELPIIAQYRCLISNIGSDTIARALGFGLTFSQQSIYLQAPKNAWSAVSTYN